MRVRKIKFKTINLFPWYILTSEWKDIFQKINLLPPLPSSILATAMSFIYNLLRHSLTCFVYSSHFSLIPNTMSVLNNTNLSKDYDDFPTKPFFTDDYNLYYESNYTWIPLSNPGDSDGVEKSQSIMEGVTFSTAFLAQFRTLGYLQLFLFIAFLLLFLRYIRVVKMFKKKRANSLRSRNNDNDNEV